MALRYLRTITENVPAGSSLSSGNNHAGFSQMQKAIDNEDNCNFTIDKWRNKVSTDIRVRSKQKDKNYKMKITEDVELTRIAAQKFLDQKFRDLKLSEEPISIGKDAIVFATTPESNSYFDFYELRRIRNRNSNKAPLVKVWNRSGKQLMESKREIFESDSQLLDMMSKCSGSDFQSFWCNREMEHYKKLINGGVACPWPLTSVKNILVLETEQDPLCIKTPDTVRGISDAYSAIVKTMYNLYRLGFVSMNLNETNVNFEGVLFDPGHVIHRSNSKANELLYKNCRNISTFFQSTAAAQKGFQSSLIPTPEKTFMMVTGNEYTPSKSRSLTSLAKDDIDMETRKAERKSKRSMLAGAKRQN